MVFACRNTEIRNLRGLGPQFLHGPCHVLGDERIVLRHGGKRIGGGPVAAIPERNGEISSQPANAGAR